MHVFHVQVVSRNRIGDGVLCQDVRALNCVTVMLPDVSQKLPCKQKDFLTVSSVLDPAPPDCNLI
jgi:hypothetical protein